MNLPECPNVREKFCSSSALRLVGEDEKAWFFHCVTCKLCWTLSKPRTKDEARYKVKLDRVKKITEEEKRVAARTKYFVMPGGR
jgi:hypothetical protein